MRLARFFQIAAMALLLVGGLPGAAGASFITGAELNQLVADHLAGQGLQAEPRLNAGRKFPTCSEPIDIKQKFGGWRTVEVSCPAQPGWQLMVRTNLVHLAPAKLAKPASRAKNDQIRSRKQAPQEARPDKLVSAVFFDRPLRRGERIRPQDIYVASLSSRQAAGSFPDSQAVIGRELKTSVNAGKPVFARQLLPVWLVRKGEELLISANIGGILVETQGRALEDGQYGAWIKVENSRSGKILAARIMAEKKVSVNAKINSLSVVK